jgi:hypothetical protein
VAFGVLVYSFSFRYFQLFPDERMLRMEVKKEELEESIEIAGRQ